MTIESSEITKEEVIDALENTKNGKALGAEDVLLELFKLFKKNCSAIVTKFSLLYTKLESYLRNGWNSLLSQQQRKILRKCSTYANEPYPDI